MGSTPTALAIIQFQMKHISIRAIIAAIVIAVFGYAVCTDALMRWFGSPRAHQIAFNAAYFIFIAPLCIHFGEFAKIGHPEYFED